MFGRVTAISDIECCRLWDRMCLGQAGKIGRLIIGDLYHGPKRPYQYLTYGATDEICYSRVLRGGSGNSTDEDSMVYSGFIPAHILIHLHGHSLSRFIGV